MSDAWSGIGAEAYCTNDLAFVLPESRPWIDRTVHRLELPGGDHPCVLLVERTRMEAGETLDGLVTAALRRAGRERRGHEIVRRSPRVVGERDAIDVAVQWSGPDGAMYVRQIHVVAGPWWIGIGVSGWAESAGACDRVAERMMSTLQLREQGANPHPSGTPLSLISTRR